MQKRANKGMTRRLVQAGVLLWAFGSCGIGFADESESLRVCADPDNLPYSNQEQQGFENKIAEVVARDLGVAVNYYWWPHQRGLLRNTVQANQCDVLVAIPKGYDPVLWTKPYFRSSYVVSSVAERKLALRSLDDQVLKKLRIGVHVNTPGYDALARHGLADNIVSYRLFFDARDADPTVRPQHLLEDLTSGVVDVAVTWGPLAGYFAKQHPSPAIEIVALEDETVEALTYEFSMGVKKGQSDLKSRLEGALERRAADIRKILEDYGVPLLPLKPPGETNDEKRPPPGSHRHDTNED
jgi:mxaJ protein